jgi:hypothetical protein
MAYWLIAMLVFIVADLLIITAHGRRILALEVELWEHEIRLRLIERRREYALGLPGAVNPDEGDIAVVRPPNVRSGPQITQISPSDLRVL